MKTNKTLRAVVAALNLLASGSAFASSTPAAPKPEVRQGCCVAPIKGEECTGTRDGRLLCPVSCVSHGGVGCPPKDTVISGVSGNKETLAANMWPAEISTGRARGDVVRFDLSGAKATKLNASGTITLPQVGSFSLYESAFTPMTPEAIAAYGKLAPQDRVIRTVIASFNLENVDLNPKSMLSPKMKEIIAAAKKNAPEAKALIWVGRLLPKETAVTELATSNSNDSDLSQSKPLNYRTTANGTAEVNLPSGETVTVDLAAVKK